MVCFQFLIIKNKAAISIAEQVWLWDLLGICPGVVKLGLEVELFRFLRKHQSDFQSGCTSLHFHQHSKSILHVPHPPQH